MTIALWNAARPGERWGINCLGTLLGWVHSVGRSRGVWRTDGASEHLSGCGKGRTSNLFPFQLGRELTQPKRWALVKWEVLMDFQHHHSKCPPLGTSLRKPWCSPGARNRLQLSISICLRADHTWRRENFVARKMAAVWPLLKNTACFWVNSWGSGRAAHWWKMQAPKLHWDPPMSFAHQSQQHHWNIEVSLVYYGTATSNF